MAIGFMLSTIISTEAWPVFAGYFCYTAAFDVSYLKSFNGMLALADQADVPYLISSFYGAAFTGMTVAVLTSAHLGDVVGVPPVLIGVACVAVGFTVVVERWYRQATGPRLR